MLQMGVFISLRTSWTPLETVSMRSANRANWDKAALSECKPSAVDMRTPQNSTAERETKARTTTTRGVFCAVQRAASQHDHKVGAPERPGPAVAAPECKQYTCRAHVFLMHSLSACLSQLVVTVVQSSCH